MNEYCWQFGGWRTDMYAFVVLLLSYVILSLLQCWLSARRNIRRKE
jgi:hypothetical protein